MNKKFQIFVSSTYEDLRDERDEVIKTCLKMGHIPVGMEMFNAADEEQWEIIQRTIDLCDYYCVIVARRYGSRGKDGVSFTEMEFDYASAKKIPVLRFLLHKSAAWIGTRVDDEPADRRALALFRGKLKEKMVSFWHDKHELAAHFSVSLSEAANRFPRPGWIRAEDHSYEAALSEISRLSSDNRVLREQLEAIKRVTTSNDEMERLTNLLKAQTMQIPIELAAPDNSGDFGTSVIEVNFAFFFIAVGVRLGSGATTSTIYSSIAQTCRNVVFPDAAVLPLKKNLRNETYQLLDSTMRFFSSIGLVRYQKGNDREAFDPYRWLSTERGARYYEHLLTTEPDVAPVPLPKS